MKSVAYSATRPCTGRPHLSRVQAVARPVRTQTSRSDTAQPLAGWALKAADGSLRAAMGLMDGTLRAFTCAAWHVTHAKGQTAGVDVHRDIPYVQGGGGRQRLDIYRPTGSQGPMPVVLYVHGGSFSTLSKSTHWMMAMPFVREGYVVASINYRLAPDCPFPVPLQDAVAATEWVLNHIAEWGGDPAQLVMAGDSAGGNLAAALVMCMCYRRPEPFARRLFERGVTPKAVVAHAGTFQLEEPDTILGEEELPAWASWSLRRLNDWYLGQGRTRQELELANPVFILESETEPDRALPAFLLSAGSADPLMVDSVRLARAAQAHGAKVMTRWYPGEGHVFHMAHWKNHAKQLWRDVHEDLTSLSPPANISD